MNSTRAVQPGSPTSLSEPLSPEAGQVAAALLARHVLDAEEDPELFRMAVHHHNEVAHWFGRQCEWPVTLDAAQGAARLCKRRLNPPKDRPPAVPRKKGPVPATPLALILVCLVCEQLWRRPSASFNDLQRAVVQACGIEAGEGRLPGFRPVALPGEGQATASAHRRAFIDALLLLESWHILRSDQPLSLLEQDQGGELLLTARRERILLLVAAMDASALEVDLDEPSTHVPSLVGARDGRDPNMAERRYEAIRAVLDDPGVCPDDGQGFLTTPAGREQALDAAAAVGLTCTVRKDWWMVGDLGGRTTERAFPQGRALEQHAALLLMRWLADREEPLAWFGPNAAAVALQEVLDANRWWASAYQDARGARRLARVAVDFLQNAGVVVPDADEHEGWRPTPAVHMWHINVAVASRPGGAHDEEDLHG
ncbi:hypothetical protein GCM10010302_75370 [Streptomyces polychromogenes]|uniref:TIGR02678 family protein n=1 Tax=Streptomyces polychromogenes TaxID=67342 RepID=A0ABP3FT71_9ACTN